MLVNFSIAVITVVYTVMVNFSIAVITVLYTVMLFRLKGYI